MKEFSAQDMTMRVRCLGVDFVVEADDRKMASEVRRAWRDAEVQSVGRSALTVSVGRKAGLDAVGDTVDGALHHLSPVVTQRAIEARTGELLMLHAAALADPDTGATAILVAPSGTGKTTAARTLGKRFAYLSDETAGIERDGRVVPYRKPLSIIEGSWIKTQVAPSSLGLLSTNRDCHVAAVLLLQRATDHRGGPVLNALETVDAVGAIAPEASALARTDRPLHRIAQVLKLGGGAHVVAYSEAATLEPVLVELLARR